MPPQEQHDLLAVGEGIMKHFKEEREQREALVLVGAGGFSYEEAAETCGVAVGTIKSRVNRARARLVELMHLDEDQVLETTDAVTAGIVSANKSVA